MTTIASDGRTVAADGQETWGAEVVRLDYQKLRIVNGVVYGITGVAAVLDACIKWHQNGADTKEAPEVKGDNAWTLLVFGAESVQSYTNTVPYPSVYPYPFAVGSGCDYAMGALLAGVSPRQAVEIAASRNIYTGGLISVVEIPHPALAAAAE